ncbi:MAG TPA: radical SAM protein, partial [Dehalococcoidales bacterium]|nr:radical SAM protein [Dehalococcoidales bacterium]
FILNGKFADNTPYYLKKAGADYEIWEENRKYADIALMPRPRYYDKLTTDGTLMFKVAYIGEPGLFRTAVNQACDYVKMGQSCRFCAVTNWWDAKLEKTPAQVGEVAAAAYSEGVVEDMFITTGTVLTPGRGIEQILETIKMVKAAGVNVPVEAQFQPPEDMAYLQELKNNGVTTVSCNVECFDESMRTWLMPMKGKLPISQYVAVWDKMVDIFGLNEVFNTLVVGTGESDESILKGVEMAASHGVITLTEPLFAARESKLADYVPPSADRMMRIYEECAKIFARYGLSPFGAGAGCAKAGGYTALREIIKYGA